MIDFNHEISLKCACIFSRRFMHYHKLVVCKLDASYFSKVKNSFRIVLVQWIKFPVGRCCFTRCCLLAPLQLSFFVPYNSVSQHSRQFASYLCAFVYCLDLSLHLVTSHDIWAQWPGRFCSQSLVPESKERTPGYIDLWCVGRVCLNLRMLAFLFVYCNLFNLICIPLL